MRITAALLLFVACSTQPASRGTPPQDSGTGGSQAPTSVPVSGSRIRVQYLQTPDGARAPWGYYDAQLASPCDFRQTSDAGYRCVPSDVSAFPDPSTYAPAELMTD